MIYVTKIYIPDRVKFKSYIDGIYGSGWLTNFCSHVQQLQIRLYDYLGVKNLLCSSHGTDALQFANHLLEKKNKEIIKTLFSFVSTYSAIVAERLTPVCAYLDIVKNTHNIDPENFQKLISINTCTIAPCHVFGSACEIYGIDKITKKHDLKVIYGASHV